MFNAIAAKDLAAVTELITEDKSLVDAKGDKDISAVLFALYYNQREIAELLVESGANLGYYDAAAMDKVEILERYLDENPEMLDSLSNDGFSALGIACFFSSLNSVKLLLSRGSNPNLVSTNMAKVAPLHSAAASADIDKAYKMASLLLDRGADVNLAQHKGWTVLQQAAHYGRLKMAELFLANGADLGAKADDGRTALDMAKDNGHIELENLLAEAG